MRTKTIVEGSWDFDKKEFNVGLKEASVGFFQWTKNAKGEPVKSTVKFRILTENTPENFKKLLSTCKKIQKMVNEKEIPVPSVKKISLMSLIQHLKTVRS